MSELRSILWHAKTEVLRQAVLETRFLRGDMAELGVYQGGTALMMLKEAPEKTMHLFDTFGGMPFCGESDKHAVGDFSDCISPESLLEALSDFKVLIYRGIFPVTAPYEFNYLFSCVHLDGDQFQTTYDGLSFFGPRLVLGGLMVCDDWDWQNCPGVRKAIELWFPNHPDFSYNVIGHQCLIKRDR